MINIDYSNKKIKVETKKVSSIFNTPLKLSIQSHVTKNEIWSSPLNDGWWAEFPNNEINDVVITDNDGKIIVERRWNIIQDGNELYKTLYYYCQQIHNSGKTPKGVAIGTHDGLFGEWVPCVLKGITEAVLVEASQPQFEKLKENFKSYSNVKLINSLVTTDGKPVEFFEGGLGYTNSVVERVIKNWEKEDIKSTIKESISIEKILNDSFDGNDIDWLHTDVEGYDVDLIKSIPVEKLPKLIIFEYENLEKEKNSEMKEYMESIKYDLNYQKVSCIALKKN
jgi:hypothetical protein